MFNNEVGVVGIQSSIVHSKLNNIAEREIFCLGIDTYPNVLLEIAKIEF